MRRIVIWLVAIMIAGSATAADLFISAEGAGTKDGSSWENAIAYNAEATGLQRAWDLLAPGATLHIAAGDYAAKPLLLSANGTKKDELRRISGQVQDGRMPRFTGTWTKEKPASGMTLFTIKDGSSWWAIENLKVSSCKVVVSCETLGQVSNGRIENIQASDIREGVILNGGATVRQPAIGTHDVLVKGCRFTNYTKRGVRIRNGCYNIRIENCVADAGGKAYALEPFHMGFSVQGGSEGVYDHDISFVNCVARNNYHDGGEGYWNADGFCAEGRAYNLTYVGCRSYDNTDGGWDDKSENPLLIGCVAMRNKKNYRFWNKKPGALLYRCIAAHSFKRGGNSAATGLWTGGKVRIVKSSFVEPVKPLDINDWRVKPGTENLMGMTLIDSIFTMNEASRDKRMLDQGSLFFPPTGKAGEAVAYAAPRAVRDIDLPGAAYDSIVFGVAKGYHSSWNNADEISKARALQPLLTKETKLLEPKPVVLYKERRLSGWYLSGWRSAKALDLKGMGRDKGNCLAFHGKGNGGSTFRTKRVSATIDLNARKPVAWVLRLDVKTDGSSFVSAKMSVYDLNKKIQTQELPLGAYLNGVETGWQSIEIPLAKFLKDPSTGYDSFAGFSIRTGNGAPLLIDNIILQPRMQ